MRRNERIPLHDHSDGNTGGLVAAHTIVSMVGIASGGGAVVSGTEPTADAHIADTSDAHDASAISVADAAGRFVATNVETALAELAAKSSSVFNVEDYGAVHDGSTDDTSAIQDAIDAAATAGGGVVYFPAGVYAVSGALADTSRSNSQLVLPAKDAVDDEPISIVLLGAYPPSAQPSVIGATPLPDNAAVLKGTLTSVSGTSPSLLGGWGPSGSAGDFSFIQVELRNLVFRLPENPVYTALDLSHIAAVHLDDVICDVSDYQIQGITEPTTSTSFGIRLPALNNSAYTRLGAVNVIGFYKGIEVGEHTVGEQVAAWGCKQAFVFVAAYHASHFNRLMTVHCERGLVFTGGAHYFTVDQFNIEHAASGWWVTDYDVDDASNYGYGHGAWKVTLAGVGHDSTFTINGGSNQHWLELGDDPFGGATSFATPAIVLGTAVAAGAASTAIRSDATIVAFDATAPTTAAFGDAAAAGSAAVAARRDHVHGMPSAPSTGIGPLLIEDTPAGSPLVFADLLQNEEGTDLLYADAV